MGELGLNGHHSIAENDESDQLASKRIFIAVTPAMLESVDEYRFAKRHRSQSSAVRKLLEIALKHEGFIGKKTPHA